VGKRVSEIVGRSKEYAKVSEKEYLTVWKDAFGSEEELQVVTVWDPTLFEDISSPVLWVLKLASIRSLFVLVVSWKALKQESRQEWKNFRLKDYLFVHEATCTVTIAQARRTFR
jgi:hypothetical protein